MAAAQFVEALSADNNQAIYASEITLIEFYDNVATWHRRGDGGATNAWITSLMADLMGWLADSAIHILSPAPKLFERAMRYVQMNIDAGKYKFRTMDAAHLVHSVDLARSLGEGVDLVSYDSDFTKLVARYPGFSRFIVQVDPRTGGDLTARS